MSLSEYLSYWGYCLSYEEHLCALHQEILHAVRVGKSCNELQWSKGARGLYKRSGEWGIHRLSILTVRRNLKPAYQKQLSFAHRTAMGKTFQWEQKPLEGNRNQTLLLQHILISFHISIYLWPGFTHKYLAQSRSCRNTSVEYQGILAVQSKNSVNIT